MPAGLDREGEIDPLLDYEDGERRREGDGAARGQEVQVKADPKGFALGLVFIAAVAVIWALASVLVQHIYDDLDFAAPFFVTFVSNSMFAMWLPVYYVAVRAGAVKPVRRGSDAELRALVGSSSDDGAGEGEYSLMRTARIGALVCPLWFLAQWSYNASLDMTSVTSSTVISTTSSLFTFLLATLLLKCERFTAGKLVGVLACMAGTTLVSLHDTEGGSLWGDLVCLFSAMMYGAYTTAIRYHVPSDDAVRMPLMFGFLGLTNLLLLLPALAVVVWTGAESLDGLSWDIMGLIIIKGLSDNVLSDYLWARAMVLTSPTIATVGLSLTIPLAIASDLVLGKESPTFESLSGAVLVVVGFVMVTAGGEIAAWVRRRGGVGSGSLQSA